MGPFGIEHEPLAKGWAGAPHQSKKAEAVFRVGRLKQRARGTHLEPKRSRNFNRQLTNDVLNNYRGGGVIDNNHSVDVVDAVARTTRPYLKQRTGKVRSPFDDINGIDHRGKLRDSRRLRQEDPDMYRSS